jgi:hypothetical protein
MWSDEGASGEAPSSSVHFCPECWEREFGENAPRSRVKRRCLCGLRRIDGRIVRGLSS